VVVTSSRPAGQAEGDGEGGGWRVAAQCFGWFGQKQDKNKTKVQILLSIEVLFHIYTVYIIPEKKGRNSLRTVMNLGRATCSCS
jgi:hypothetical protein